MARSISNDAGLPSLPLRPIHPTDERPMLPATPNRSASRATAAHASARCSHRRLDARPAKPSFGSALRRIKAPPPTGPMPPMRSVRCCRAGRMVAAGNLRGQPCGEIVDPRHWKLSVVCGQLTVVSCQWSVVGPSTPHQKSYLGLARPRQLARRCRSGAGTFAISGKDRILTRFQKVRRK